MTVPRWQRVLLKLSNRLLSPSHSIRDPEFNYYSPDPGADCVKPEIEVGDDGT
jgi:hypothetical protein